MATTVAEVMDILKNVAKMQEDLSRAQRKTEEAQQEMREAMARSQKNIEEAQLRTEKAQQKTEKAQQDMREDIAQSQKEMREAIDRTQKNIDKANGNFNNKWGIFLENLVKGDLVKLLQGINIQVERVQPRMIMPETPDCRATELDLVAMNGREIVVVEVKTTATKKKVNIFLGKLRAFRKALPEYGDKTVYGAMAYLTQPEGEGVSAANYAQEEGLYIIVSPGGETSLTAIVNNSSFLPRKF